MSTSGSGRSACPCPCPPGRTAGGARRARTPWTPRTARASTFAVTGKRKPKRPFQGHQELVLQGTWQEATSCELPAGTLWIEARQPLARLAATLLEPESEDSLSTWNFLEERTVDRYPLVRIVN